MSIRFLSRDEIFTEKPEWREPGRSRYLAMYSSVFDGVVTDPALMVIPLDDHIINRGDGIFEFFPVKNGYAYCFNAHMARLERSAEMVSLDLPFDIDTIRQIALDTIAISGARDCGVRIFISRGLGDFGGPTTPEKSLLYIIVLGMPPTDIRTTGIPSEGVSAITTHVPIKPGLYAQVKTTCYLLNALVQLEAHQKGARFGIWYDHDGHLAEAATENVAIVTKEKIFKYPRFEHMLKGTGLIRGVELAEELVISGELGGISQTDITQHEVYESLEMLIVGSGRVIPIVKYDGRTISTGKPGPVSRRLWELFEKDRTEGPDDVRTPVPYR